MEMSNLCSYGKKLKQIFKDKMRLEPMTCEIVLHTAHPFPPVPPKTRTGLIEKNESEQLGGTVHEMQQ